MTVNRRYIVIMVALLVIAAAGVVVLVATPGPIIPPAHAVFAALPWLAAGSCIGWLTRRFLLRRG